MFYILLPMHCKVFSVVIPRNSFVSPDLVCIVNMSMVFKYLVFRARSPLYSRTYFAHNFLRDIVI